jgi:purine-binding chemotaxis protein CheW
MDVKEQTPDATKLLAVFSLGEALFAVEALRVQEIIRVGAITPVHGALPHVLGIINLRGRIVSVLDPAIRMGFPSQERTPESRILIVDWQDEHLGLLVSWIQDMVDAEEGSIGRAPSNLKADLGKFLSGVFQRGESMISVLDLQPLLSLEEIL